MSDELVPFGEPFCDMLVPPGAAPARPRVWKLERDARSGDELLRVRWRTAWFSVFIPVRVDFRAGKLLPSQRCRRLNDDAQWVELCEFPVEAQPARSADESFVRLSPRPSSHALPRHVVVRAESRLEFLSALAPNRFDERGRRTRLPEKPPWLKVRIDGKEGWVRDEADLSALGLSPAG